jgi:hypothetical protein
MDGWMDGWMDGRMDMRDVNVPQGKPANISVSHKVQSACSIKTNAEGDKTGYKYKTADLTEIRSRLLKMRLARVATLGNAQAYGISGWL